MAELSSPDRPINAQLGGNQVADPIVVSPFSGGQEAMDEIAAFHLAIRQWQVDNQNNVFSNFFESQVDLPHIDDYYLRGNGNFFVARTAVTDQLVGIVGFRDDGDGHGVLKRMAVDPEHHRQGIGTRLVDSLVEHARTHDFKKVTLTTGEKENAKPIYEKAGFRVVGRVVRNRDYMMELDLTEVSRKTLDI
jgi:GNAT superfamily N-acetyltransferase